MREVRLSPSGDFDNRQRDYAHFAAAPFAAALGAEIQGLKLATITDGDFGEFREAFWHHKVLFIRDQHLTHAEHEAFAARFGPFSVDVYTSGVPGHRNVQPVIKEADHVSKALFGSGWHTDSAFLDHPPALTILRSVEVPPFGGDTVWANCALAFRMLSPAMQAMLRPLKVRMSAESNSHTQEKLSGKAMSFSSTDHRAAAFEGMAHPLVRRHPMTGEESLYVDEVYATGIDGMTEAESRPLLDFLCRHITQHGFTCRLRWEAGMVVLWDNRTTLHLAANDYDGHRREMYRTTIASDTA